MAPRGSFLTLKKQLLACVGFIVLFCGLLFHFLGDIYPMFNSFKHLFVIVDCLGGCIVVLALFLTFFPYRNNLKESWKPLVIESTLTLAFNFSLQALLFHLLFTNSLSPVNLGTFFIFISYLFAIISLAYSLSDNLIKKYSVISLIAIIFVSLETLTSGVFLTFTGSIEQITNNGFDVFFLGIFSLSTLIIVFIFYPKWKHLLLEDENEEIEENEDDEGDQ